MCVFVEKTLSPVRWKISFFLTISYTINVLVLYWIVFLWLIVYLYHILYVLVLYCSFSRIKAVLLWAACLVWFLCGKKVILLYASIVVIWRLCSVGLYVNLNVNFRLGPSQHLIYSLSCSLPPLLGNMGLPPRQGAKKFCEDKIARERVPREHVGNSHRGRCL